MAEHYNPGFAFYNTYYKAIEKLPLEEQKEICYALVKYGITYEIVDDNEMPHGYSSVINNQQSIINSVERWIANQNKANQKIDSNISRDRAIAQLISQGYKSKEIAMKISEMYGPMSDSAVRKTAPWIERKDPDFREKWIGEICENSQNFTKNECENSCEKNVTEREDSQIFTEAEQNFPILEGAAASF